MSINEAINIQTTSINAIAPTTGSLSIGDSQTTGVLNLGTGTGRTATGAINIGNSTGSSIINLETANTGTSINIGTLNTTSTKTIKLGNSTTGANATKVYINNLEIVQDIIGNVTRNTGSIQIGPFQTSGTIQIGSNGGAVRTGAISIANDAESNCNINIISGARSTSNFNVLTTAGTGSTAGLVTSGTINLGTATTGIVGAVTTTVNIASGSTTGAVTIGNTGNTTTLASGTTNIATSVGSTSVINILNGGGATTGGSVNIANGASQTTAVNISSGTGTGTVTIGNPSNTTNLNSSTVNISRNTSNTTNTFVEVVSGSNFNSIEFHSSGLFNTGSDSRITTFGGTAVNDTGTIALVAGEVQMNAPLKMGTGDNITLQPTTGYVAPTALTMLGGISSVTPSTTLPSTTNVVGSIRLTSAGVYIINWSYQINWTVRPTYFYSNIANATTAVGVTPVINSSNWGYTDLGLVFAANFTTTSGSAIVQATVNNYYNLLIYISGGSITINGGFYNITRIA